MRELTAWWKEVGNGRREVTSGRDIEFARLRSWSEIRRDVFGGAEFNR
jgi:hypothetical protein